MSLQIDFTPLRLRFDRHRGAFKISATKDLVFGCLVSRVCQSPFTSAMVKQPRVYGVEYAGKGADFTSHERGPSL